MSAPTAKRRALAQIVREMQGVSAREIYAALDRAYEVGRASLVRLPASTLFNADGSEISDTALNRALDAEQVQP